MIPCDFKFKISIEKQDGKIFRLFILTPMYILHKSVGDCSASPHEIVICDL